MKITNFNEQYKIQSPTPKNDKTYDYGKKVEISQ